VSTSVLKWRVRNVAQNGPSRVYILTVSDAVQGCRKQRCWGTEGIEIDHVKTLPACRMRQHHGARIPLAKHTAISSGQYVAWYVEE
jgi:hypothetical protein